MRTLCLSLIALALVGPACANAGSSTGDAAPANHKMSAANGEESNPGRADGNRGADATPNEQLTEARQLLRAGNGDRALTITDRLLAADPDNRAARLVAGHGNAYLATLGRSNTESLLNDAASNFRHALDINENDPSAWYALADVQLKLSEFEEGSESAQTAAKQWASGGQKGLAADAMLRAADNEMQAFVALRSEELKDGEASNNGIVPVESDTAEAATRVITLCNGARSERPGPAHRRAATVQQWLSNPLAALDELERGILTDPNDEETHNALLALRWSMGQHREAIGAYGNMVKESGAPILRWHLGRARFGYADELRRRGDTTGATKAYDQAEASFADYAQAVPAHQQSALWWQALCALSTARLAVENGNLEIAEERLAKAFELDPRVAEKDESGRPLIYHTEFGNSYEGDLFRIGTTYAGQGTEEGLRAALEFFTRINEKHPRMVGQFYNNAGLAARDLGAMLAARGDTAEAQELWERSYRDYCVAVELQPGDPRIVNDCGLMLIYHLHREHDRAMKLFEQAIAVGTPMFEALSEDAPIEERNFVEEALGDAYQNTAVLMAQQGRPFADMKAALEKAVMFYPYQRREAASMLRRGAAGQPVLGQLPAGASLNPAANGAASPAPGGAAPRGSLQDPQDPVRAKAFAEKVKAADEKAQKGDFDGALLVMDRIAKDMTGYAPFHIKSGQFNFELAKQRRDSGGDVGLVSGLFEDAKRHLRKAVELDSEPFAPRQLLGDVEYETGDYGGAVRTASELILHMSSTGTASAEQIAKAHGLKANAAARAYIAAKQNGQDATEALTDARVSFKMLAEKGTLDEPGYSLWATLEEWSGAGDQAMQTLQRGITAHSGSQTLLGSLVDTAGRTSKNEVAVETLAKFEDPTSLWYLGKARFNAAEQYRLEQKLDEAVAAAAQAIDDFDGAMTANPGFTASSEQWKTFCLAKLADLQLRQGKSKEAEQNIMAALELRPDQIDGFISSNETIKVVLLRVADPYIQKGDLENAERIFRKATALVPNDAILANNHGLFARDLADRMRRGGGDNDAARKELYEASYSSYRRAVDLDPENVRLKNDCALITIYHVQKEWDEAKQLLDEGIALGERQLKEQDLTGDALNQLEEAVGDCYENLALYHLRHSNNAQAALDAANKSMDYYPGPNRGGANRHKRAAQKILDGGK